MQFNYEKFKKIRAAVLSIEELSKQIDISANVLKNIESGRKNITPESVEFEKLKDFFTLEERDFFVRDTKVLTFFNNKGGATKTSSVATIGHILAKEYGKRVLMIDCDQQANLSLHFNMLEVAELDERNLYQAFAKQESIAAHIRGTGYENLDIVISHYDVGRIEPSLPTMTFREQRFSAILKEVKESGSYDFILCDCAPTISMFNNIILRATDGVVIPMVPDAFNLAGLSNTIEYLDVVIDENKLAPDNHQITILGIFINKYDKRIKMSHIISEVLKKVYDEEGYLFETFVGTDSAMGKAQAEKKPLGVNYSKGQAYQDYKALAKEIIERANRI